MCSGNVNFGSKLRPNLFGGGLVARMLLFLFRLKDSDYLVGSGANRVHCVLFMLMVVQVEMEFKYG